MEAQRKDTVKRSEITRRNQKMEAQRKDAEKIMICGGSAPSFRVGREVPCPICKLQLAEKKLVDHIASKHPKGKLPTSK